MMQSDNSALCPSLLLQQFSAEFLSFSLDDLQKGHIRIMLPNESIWDAECLSILSIPIRGSIDSMLS